MYLLFGLEAVWDSSLLPRVCRLSYSHLLLVQMGIVGGWCLPLELSGFSRPQDLHLRQGFEVGRFSFVHAIGLNWLLFRCCSQRVIRSRGWSELDWGRCCSVVQPDAGARTLNL